MCSQEKPWLFIWGNQRAYGPLRNLRFYKDLWSQQWMAFLCQLSLFLSQNEISVTNLSEIVPGKKFRAYMYESTSNKYIFILFSCFTRMSTHTCTIHTMHMCTHTSEASCASCTTCNHVFVCTVVYGLSSLQPESPVSPPFYLTDTASLPPLHWGEKQKALIFITADTMPFFMHNYRNMILQPPEKFFNTQSQWTLMSIFNRLCFRGFHVNYLQANLLKWLL
jgi:hypothetical protein